jgi:hypothetical protein
MRRAKQTSEEKNQKEKNSQEKNTTKKISQVLEIGQR